MSEKTNREMREFDADTSIEIDIRDIDISVMKIAPDDRLKPFRIECTLAVSSDDMDAITEYLKQQWRSK